MLRKFLIAGFAIALSLSPANAYWHGVSVSSGPSGISQINMGGDTENGEDFTNVFKGCGLTVGSNSFALFDADGYPISSLSSGITCQILTIHNIFSWKIICPSTRYNCSITLLNATNVSVNNNFTLTGGSGSGNTTFACSNAAGCDATFTFVTSPGTMTVNFNAVSYAAGRGGWGLCRPANLTPPADDCSQFALASSTSGTSGSFFTPEFISSITTANFAWLRNMGWVQQSTSTPNSTNQANWAYRTHVTDVQWVYNGQGRFIPSANSGGHGNASPTLTQSLSSTSGTTPIVYTGAPTDDQNNGVNSGSLGAWADGEVVQGAPGTTSGGYTVTASAGDGTTNCSGSPCVKLTVSSTTNLNVNNLVYVESVTAAGFNSTEADGKHTITGIPDSTHVILNVPFSTASSSTGCMGIQSLTITGKSGGAKFIANNGGFPFGCSGAAMSGSMATFTYDATSDLLIYTVGGNNGIVEQIPYEAQINLANKTNANLWLTVPIMANNAYISSLATLAYNMINSQLAAGFELANEVWNSFSQTYIAANRGFNLGINLTTGGSALDSKGLRTRQISDLVLAAGWSGQRSRVKIILAGQWVAIGNEQSLSWNGTHLNPSTNQALCLYLGGTFSGSCSLSSAFNYSASPNRPIDVTDYVAYAPYAGGTNLNQGADVCLNCTLTAAQAPFLQSVVTAWVANDPTNQAIAVALIDDDLHQGRINIQTATCSGTTFSIPTTPSGPASFTSPYDTRLNFQVTGGTTYSGIATNQMYKILSITPGTPTTFTLQAMVNGSATGTAVNCGSAGSGTTTVGSINTQATFATDNILLGQANELTQTWNYTANSYNPPNATRPTGMGTLGVVWYEGGEEVVGTTTASQYTNISVVPATVTPTCTTNGTITVDSCTISAVPSIAGVYKGMVVSATDITASQTVTSIDVANSRFTLSAD